MGISCSRNSGSSSVLKSFSKKEALYYPGWCLLEVDTGVEVSSTVASTWQQILSGETEAFVAAKQRTSTLTPIVFFHDSLFLSFFELCPDCKALFKRGYQSQARMFAHIIRFLCNNMEKGEGFEATMRYVAILHNHMGLNAKDLSAFGLCMLRAVRNCLGEERYTLEVKYAWTALYSRIMQIFVPVVVSGLRDYDSKMIAKKNEYLAAVRSTFPAGMSTMDLRTLCDNTQVPPNTLTPRSRKFGHGKIVPALRVLREKEDATQSQDTSCWATVVTGANPACPPLLISNPLALSGDTSTVSPDAKAVCA